MWGFVFIYHFLLAGEAFARENFSQVIVQVVPDVSMEVSPSLLLTDLSGQDPGFLWKNPLKHAIRLAVSSGISVETIVLLLLLPSVASVVAAARQLVGLRGFGIFLPASLAVVFLATGPVVGIGLFLVIVTVSTLFRLLVRRLKIKFQYLPRMALTLWVVSIGVLGILFLAPLLQGLSIPEVSIFPVLIMILLAEDFTKVQMGKSIGVAISLTTETVVLGLVLFGILSLSSVQRWALLNPELAILVPFVFDVFLGQYVGLRLLELWRLRKLIAR